jgi:E3 ubiquitin-protein ligase SHPRH
MAVFFQANAYFQMKERFEKPDTPEFVAMEKLEVQGYEIAKRLRQEILQEVSNFKIVSRISGIDSETDIPKG